MFGNLSWSAIPIHEPIDMIASGLMILMIISFLVGIAAKGLWSSLWREWLTSVDTNNVLALAFGILIVVLVVAGSLWIMANLNANLMPAVMG